METFDKWEIVQSSFNNNYVFIDKIIPLRLLEDDIKMQIREERYIKYTHENFTILKSQMLYHYNKSPKKILIEYIQEQVEFKEKKIGTPSFLTDKQMNKVMRFKTLN